MLRLPVDLNGHHAYYQRINYHDGQRDIIELTNGEISKKVIDIKSNYSPDYTGLKTVYIEYMEDILTDREIDKVTRIIEKMTVVKNTENKIKAGKQKTLY
jgi:hypothetical protein